MSQRTGSPPCAIHDAAPDTTTRDQNEAFDALLLENDAALFTAECFEAALRIDKRQPQNDSNDLVENDAANSRKGDS